MVKDKSKPKYHLLFILPIALILTTALVFFIFSNFFGSSLGYFTGFSFYYVVWCYSVPLALIGKDGFVSLFKEANPLFRKRNWHLIILFFLLIFGTLIMYLIPSITEATLVLVLLAIPIAIVHGVGEETLWRGLYVRAFPENAFLGIIYPTVGFALWHLSPQIIFPAENGILIFLVSTFFLGLTNALIAYKTSSISGYLFFMRLEVCQHLDNQSPPA